MAGIDQDTAKPVLALEPSAYCDAGAYERERDAIFKKSWRLVGHENMAPNSGDYFSDSLAGVPIVVVRQEDGTLKGHHNICRHRAGPLVADSKGHCGKELTCKYHGWRYALDGRLKSARDFGAVEGFDPRDYVLTPVTIGTWRGFVFATLNERPAPIADEMQAVGEDWPDQTVAPFAFQRSHNIACNWKTYVENYLEGYHVPDVHPGLDKEVDSSAYRVEMKDATAVHYAPPLSKDAVYSGYWGWVWPWVGVNVYQYGVMMERITPISVCETRLDYLYFFDPDRHDELNAMIAMSDEVTNEDKMICEHVAKNLNAGTYQPGPLSLKHENAVLWFHDRLRQLMGYK
ncbi:MAG: hypothetical protein DHS20C05_22780 [Hyphococcus sp.]|nr:MAG: hypothetical protein DHS20C05_22780 [Marinicaulis sp.]